MIAIDTETWPIERQPDGSVIPKLVCVSIADNIESTILLSTADFGLEKHLRKLLESDELLVFHNAAFDVPVLCKAFPKHEPLWWKALEDGRVTDTMLREQLLNLSTTGKLDALVLPDGSAKRIEYGLAALVLKYLNEDISESKEGTQRTDYYLLDGKPAADYPEEAARYAAMDASYTLSVFMAQEECVQSEDGFSSLSTDRFQTAASVALAWITDAGMAIDRAEFQRLRLWLEDELSTQRLAPLFSAGILRDPVPAMPHKRQEAAARELIAEWLGIAPEDVDWNRLSAGLCQAAIDAGIKFKDAIEPKRNDTALRDRVLRAYWKKAGFADRDDLTIDLLEKRGISVKRTPKNDVSTAKEVIDELADDDPILKVYQHRQKLQKLVTTELPRMMWQGGPAPEVHFPYKTLVETGRTSSFATDKYPSANGQNVDPRARPAFRARPGHVLVSCDYAMLELVCVAQTTYDLFGHSVHRDKINLGYDLHAYLGTTLALNLHPEFGKSQGSKMIDEAYRYFKSLEYEDPKFYKLWRTLAKPVGLGFPGGLGPLKILELAKKEPYHIDFVEMAEKRFVEHPEEFKVTSSVLFYAQKLFGMQDEEFEWRPLLKGIALAGRLREIWLSTYPEMVEYFSWVNAQKDINNQILGVSEEDEAIEGLCYTTPMGMHRAGATYTAVANGRAMQSPAAEGFKTAAFMAVRECRIGRWRGLARVVNEIHDELIVEVVAERADQLAIEIQQLMERAMGAIISDVKVRAEPCLMYNWHKAAEPVFDSLNRLAPWEPDKKYEKRGGRLYLPETVEA